jgi:hypothetical protein
MKEVDARLDRIEEAIMMLAAESPRWLKAKIVKTLTPVPDLDGAFDDPSCSPGFAGKIYSQPSSRCTSRNERLNLQCMGKEGHQGSHWTTNGQSSMVVAPIMWGDGCQVCSPTGHGPCSNAHG